MILISLSCCDTPSDPEDTLMREELSGPVGSLSFVEASDIQYHGDINMRTGMVSSRFVQPLRSFLLDITFDGKMIITEGASVSWITLDMKKTILCKELSGEIFSPEISPKNDMVMYQHKEQNNQTSIVIRETASGGRELKRFADTADVQIKNWAWTAKGFLVLYIYNNGMGSTLISKHPVDPTTIPDFSQMTSVEGGGTVSPDATRIIYQVGRHLWQRKVDGSDMPIQVTDSESNEYNIHYSPGGNHIAFLSPISSSPSDRDSVRILSVSLSDPLPVHTDSARRYFTGRVTTTFYRSLLRWWR